MEILLKGLRGGRSAAFQDSKGWFYEADYNGYILPIINFAFYGDIWTESYQYFEKLSGKKLLGSLIYDPLFDGNVDAQKYLLKLYVDRGHFYKYLVYINDNFDYRNGFHNQTICELLSIVLRNTKDDRFNRLFKGYAKLDSSSALFSPDQTSTIHIFKSNLLSKFTGKDAQVNLIKTIPLSAINKFIAFYNGIKIETKDSEILWFGNDCEKIDLDNPPNGFNLRKYFEESKLT